jgi:hypothetical protein
VLHDFPIPGITSGKIHAEPDVTHALFHELLTIHFAVWTTKVFISSEAERNRIVFHKCLPQNKNFCVPLPFSAQKKYNKHKKRAFAAGTACAPAEDVVEAHPPGVDIITSFRPIQERMCFLCPIAMKTSVLYSR